MRFVDFLKATVLLSAGAASLLAAIAVLGASRDADETLVYVSAGWWAVAILTGAWLGRRTDANPPIARLLASARTTTALPEQTPRLMLLNRLWPLLALTVIAGGLGVFIPQVAAVAAGFAIVTALAWRHQESAVSAIEERDGIRFYLDKTSPLAPIKLVRTPGFGGHFLGV